MLGQFFGERASNEGHLPSGHAVLSQAALNTMRREQGKAPSGVGMDNSLVSEAAGVPTLLGKGQSSIEDDCFTSCVLKKVLGKGM